MKSNDELLQIAIDTVRNSNFRNTSKGNRSSQTIIAMAYDSNQKLLCSRYNSYRKTHPLQKHFAVLAGRPDKIFLHAEISALVSTRKKVHTLVVARVNSLGEPELAAPCPICQIAIDVYEVENVIFSVRNEEDEQ
jgi:tRNA(Arg) A34 adenosine deaminase TadA